MFLYVDLWIFSIPHIIRALIQMTQESKYLFDSIYNQNTILAFYNDTTNNTNNNNISSSKQMRGDTLVVLVEYNQKKKKANILFCRLRNKINCLSVVSNENFICVVNWSEFLTSHIFKDSNIFLYTLPKYFVQLMVSTNKLVSKVLFRMSIALLNRQIDKQ